MNSRIIKLFEQFPNEDNIYRDHLQKNFNCKWSEDTAFPLLFCGHESISDIIEVSDDPFGQFKQICDRVAPFPDFEVTPELREANIESINNKQAAFLRQRDGIVEYESCPDDENDFSRVINTVNVGMDVGSDRALVLYFRRESLEQTDGYMCHTAQMDYFQFCIIAYILSKYINTGQSLVFNKIKIVSRESNLYPKYIHKLADIEYVNTSGNDFIKTTCIGANTIHFLHGTAPDNKCGSMPVYSNQMLLDDKRKNDEYIHLDLNFNMKNDDDPVYYKGDYVTIKTAFEREYKTASKPSIHLIANNTLETIRELEYNLLNL